jgi:hypothetical protein
MRTLAHTALLLLYVLFWKLFPTAFKVAVLIAKDTCRDPGNKQRRVLYTVQACSCVGEVA